MARIKPVRSIMGCCKEMHVVGFKPGFAMMIQPNNTRKKRKKSKQVCLWISDKGYYWEILKFSMVLLRVFANFQQGVHNFCEDFVNIWGYLLRIGEK